MENEKAWSINFEDLIAGGIFVFVLGFFGWLLLRRCRFTLEQLFVTVFIFGLLMSLTSNWIIREGDSNGIVWASLWHIASLMLGLYMGSRRVSALPPQAGFTRRWVDFGLGLFRGYIAFLGICIGLVIAVTLILGIGISFTRPTFLPLLCVFLGTVVFVVLLGFLLGALIYWSTKNK